ncbi:MAG: response regulator [Chloroflexi bacterium]|nr:response regulator [Chloroflexota bacterium]
MTSTSQSLLKYVISVSGRMTETRNLDFLLPYVIDEVLKLVGAERGYLVLINEKGELDFKVSRHHKSDFQEQEKDEVSLSILNEVFRSSQSLILTNAMMDPRFSASQSVVANQLRSVMCTPLISQNRTIGAIYVENRSINGLFRKDDLKSLELFANQAAVSIDNANLYTDLERRIATQKEIEIELRATQEQLQATLTALPDLMLELDANGRIITYHSPQSNLLPLLLQDIVGNTVHEALPQAAAKGIMTAIQLANQQGQHTGTEFSVASKTKMLWFEVSISRRGASTNDNGRYVTLIRNITDRKQLEDQLRHAQKMEAIGQLAGGVAHDFNNLLSIILSYGQLILRANPDIPATAVHRLKQIIHAGERAAELTKQLLAFSRKQILEPQIVNLNENLLNITSMLERIIGENIELTTISFNGLEPIRVDPSQLEQVVFNLAINARDAMPQGGMLTIETSNVYLDNDYASQHSGVNTGAYVMLAVSDTGEGFDEDTKTRIFEPFFTTKEKGKGTGLGLATVYGIVNQSDGHIWVYSEKDQGTTFKIYFPQIQEGTKASYPLIQKNQETTGTETILLIEDEKTVRTLSKDILELNGYTILEATDSDHAQEINATYDGEIHLLLTDVVMPKLNGRELAEIIVINRPQMKVLYMSGYTDNVIVHHGVLKADMAFLQKPITPNALAQKVRQVLDS